MKRFVTLLLCISVFLSGCGYSESYVESERQDAYDEGFSSGSSEGYDNGYNDGRSEGYDIGYNDGCSEHEGDYSDGYAEGYFDASKGYEPQYEINIVGYDEPEYDNGSLTRAQVAELQKYYGLTADGYWGPASQKAAGDADDAWKKYQAAKNAASIVKTTPIPTPTPTPTPTPSQATSYTVYITKTGEKYHKYGCQYLAESRIAIDLSRAKARGYTACLRCW